MTLEFDEMADKSLPDKTMDVIKMADKPKPKLNHEASVTRQVLDVLGTPTNLHKVRTANVFDSNWRVDLWTWKWLDEQSKITKSMVIEYSFFVKYDEDAGRIVSCDPEIVNINTNNF
jgi:hypothetical protein|tara:strand:- start:812 stop:1162 length:351 start_codon:yes stop_codon:yes gene_type:complete